MTQQADLKNFAPRAKRRQATIVTAVVAGGLLLGVGALLIFGFGRATHSTGHAEAERLNYKTLGEVTYVEFQPDRRLLDVEPGAPTISSVNWLGNRTAVVLKALKESDYTCEQLDKEDLSPIEWTCRGIAAGGERVEARVQYREDTKPVGEVPDPNETYSPETALRLYVRT